MKTQEQSSTLKEEVPKNKQGLLDKYEKEPEQETFDKVERTVTKYEGEDPKTFK